MCTSVCREVKGGSRLGRSLALPVVAIPVATVLFLFASSVASAQRSFATRSRGGADVLRVRANIEATEEGYRILRVTISNRKRKSPADRDLVVMFYTKEREDGLEPISYRVPVRLPEGQSQVVVEIPYAGIDGQWYYWDVSLFEGRRDIEDKRGRKGNSLPFVVNNGSASNGSYAAIQGTNESSKTIDKGLNQLFPKNVRNNAGVRVARTLGSRVVPVKEARTDWRTYFPYSVWTVSAATLKEINATFPSVSAALRNYIAAGGTLLVHSAAEPSDIQELERLLVAPGVPTERAATERAAERGGWASLKTGKVKWWRLGVDPDDFISEEMVDDLVAAKKAAADQGPISLQGTAYDASIGADTWLQAKIGAHVANIKESWSLLGMDDEFGRRGTQLDAIDRYRDSMIVALDTESILKRRFLGGSILFASKPLTNLPHALLQKALRSTASTNANTLAIADGNWFWRNLITAVGKPPVWTFCAIVALFGALLGPGLLFLTGRIARRSLMIFLVPAISFAATSAIIAYGVFHEGFDTHIRITSVSRIDVGSNVGFAWSRQNYFSGLPPRDGLNFPTETYVRPVSSDRDANYSSNPRNGTRCVVTLTDGQNWRGWLKSRQQQQMMIGHPVENPKSPIGLTHVAGGNLSISNQSEQTLPFVVVRGAQDDYYFVEGLGAGKTASIAPDTREVVGARVARLMVDYSPVAPSEMQEGGSLLNTFGWGSNRRGRRRSGWGRYSQTQGRDIVNVALSTYMSDRLVMQPFSFATILSQNEAIEVPLEGKHSDGLHIVIGTQPW